MQKSKQDSKQDTGQNLGQDSGQNLGQDSGQNLGQDSGQNLGQDLLVEQLLGFTNPLANSLANSLASPRRALAKAITLAESPRRSDQQRVSVILKQLRKTRSKTQAPPCRRIGIVGAPGAGKSSLIAALCAQILQKSQVELNKDNTTQKIAAKIAPKIAVVAIDPSAVGGGGAILADKTRMPGITDNPQIFVRPSPAVKGQALVRGLLESISIFEACGFTHIIIEAVGSGQAETAIADYVDCLILLVSTKSGDALQGMKRGILEIADFLIVSKADGAERAKARKTLGDYQQAARCFLTNQKNKLGAYRICSAQRTLDVEKLRADVEQFFAQKTKKELAHNRAKQKQNLFLQAWCECAIEYAMQQLLEQELELAQEQEQKTAIASPSNKASPKSKPNAQKTLNERFAQILKQLAKPEPENADLTTATPSPAESAREFFWGAGTESKNGAGAENGAGGGG